jgi:hypothetical protein
MPRKLLKTKEVSLSFLENLALVYLKFLKEKKKSLKALSYLFKNMLSQKFFAQRIAEAFT